jgi:two-component system response regulator AtoC
MSESVLIIEDDAFVRWTLRERVERDGYLVREADTGSGGLKAFADGADAVLLDLRLPDADGLDLLRRFKTAAPEVPVVLLTAHSSVNDAVYAMKQGAYHYATKPVDLDDVSRLLSGALDETRAHRQARRQRTRDTGDLLDEIIGTSSAIVAAKQAALRVAQSPASTVLLTGESGTGKDLLAHAIHDASARSHGPFVNVTCSALTETLVESELFGYERGAFMDARQQRLFENATEGTLFLHEIGEMSLTGQAKLLRFLEEKAFRRLGGTAEIHPNVRVIAATNRDLSEAVEAGTFRADLYYRLAVVHIVVPPLRERRDDITDLAVHFVERFNVEFDKDVRGLSERALALFRKHAWLGNVRELRNVIERAMLFTDARVLDVEHFEDMTRAKMASRSFRLPADGIDLADLERDLVQQALSRASGNRTRAAALLGINRDQVRYRIAKFGLEDHADHEPVVKNGSPIR